MPLNSNASARLVISSGLPGSSTNFVMAFWCRFGTTTGLPVLINFDNNYYIYIDGGNLYLQFVNCGTAPTDWGHIVLRRTGSSLQLWRCAAGATSYTMIGEDTSFGTGAISQMYIWGDETFGSPDDIDLYDMRFWYGSTLPTNSDLLIERWNYHPQFTTGLAHHIRFNTVSNFGNDEINGTHTTTGTPVLVAPRLVVVGDSIASGRLELEDTPDPDSWAGSNGLIASESLSGLGFVLVSNQAIPAESMHGHLDAIGTRLIPSLEDFGPGSIYVFFGSVNDHFSYTAEQTYNAIVTMAQECHKYGAIPIGAGPTDAPAWSTEVFSAAIRGLIMADTENFAARWNVQGNYANPSGGDGIHPPSYTTLGAFGRAQLDIYINGTTFVVTYEVVGFRFRNDNGSETTATWIDEQNENVYINKSTNFRLRILTNYSGDMDSHQRTLYYRRVGDPDWEIVE